MESFFKGESNIYYNMLCRETKKSMDGLQILGDVANRIEKNVKNSSDIRAIQQYMKMLSTYSQILATFNAKVETMISAIDEQTFKAAMRNCQENAIRLRIKDWLNADLSSYQVGDIDVCTITHIVDSEQRLCFVKSATKYGSVDVASDLVSELNDLPDFGYVFAIQIEMKFFRVVRVNMEPTATMFCVRLIDLGETVCLSPNVRKFELNEMMQQAPPKAMLCSIIRVDGKFINSLNGISTKKKFQFKVNNICINMLELDLFSLDEIEAMKKSLQETIGCFEHSDTESLSPVPASAATTNPFLQSLPVQAEEYVTEVSTPISNGDTGIHTTMQPSFPKVSTSFSPGQGNISMDLSPELSPITGPNMTPKLQLPPVPPRRTSKQAPIRIPSHVVASWHNSKPHDNSMELFAQKARENFTSPKTNGVKKGANGDMHLSNGLSRSQDAPATCTAGAHPKWEKAENSHAQWPELKSHFQNHKNFADNLKSPSPTPSDNSNAYVLKLPHAGETITLSPTHITDVHEFYAHLYPLDSNFKAFELHEQLSTFQNSLRPVSFIPDADDLILAQYTGDNRFYRAKVLQAGQTGVKVFYVDYGNCEYISIDRLYEWEPICSTAPFQAVFCRLKNAEGLVENMHYTLKDEIIGHLNNNCLNRMLHTNIVSKEMDCIVVDNLMDSTGKDVTAEIINQIFSQLV